MKNNKLQPVEIHDLFTYQFPGNLLYSPDGKFLAFEVAKEDPPNLPSVVRRKVRDAMVEHHVAERMVHDIKYLLSEEGGENDFDGDPGDEREAVYLWDDRKGAVENGKSYGGEDGDDEW